MNDWGQLNPPRNLTYGVFRGGARPVDVYWRIKLGVGGSGMPAASDTLTDEQIWHLVDYVMTLPTQQR
jgi:mono/diheme cytochrome c family protein